MTKPARKSVKSILSNTSALAVIAAAVFTGMPAHAQETDEEEEAIVVTGTRIARDDLVAAGPVTVMTAEDLERTGAVSVDDILQQLPTVSGDVVGAGTNNGGNGTSNVALRGLGAQRTLVLINGRRGTPGGGLGVGGGVANFVDLTSIPTGMIERIEVYQDGASAVYGSDAIAGVVNVILRNDFNGIAAEGTWGISGEDDGFTEDYNVTLGISNDRGHMLFGIGYLNREGILQGDRAFSECAKASDPAGDLYCLGSYNAAGGFAFNVGPGGYSYFGAPYNSYYLTWHDSEPIGRAWNGAPDTFNYAARSLMTQPSERWNITGAGEYELDMGLTVFAEGYFTERRSLSQLAPDPAPPNGPGTYGIASMYIPAANPYNPTGVPLYMYRRMLELGDRQYDNSVQTYRVVSGLRGDFGDTIPSWSWEASALFGASETSLTGGPLAIASNITTALDPVLCAANATCSAAAATAGQTAMNPFGQTTIDPAFVPFISAPVHDTSRNELTVLTVSATGDLFNLPAGMVRAAVGAEHIDQFGFYEPDFLKTTGQVDETSQPTRGGFHSTEVFGELDIPLIADAPLVDSLSVGLAARYAEYNTFGSTTTWKIALNYNPIPELRFRGIVSEATRAPSIIDLFAGSLQSFDFATDPCEEYEDTFDPGSNRFQNCVAAGVPVDFGGANADQILTTYNANPNLDPETATTTTFGTVWRPDFADLTVAVDYWKYKIEDYIANIDTTQLLNLCYDGPVGLTSPFCAFNGGRNAINQIIGNVNPLLNLPSLETEGWDFDVNYRTEAIGPGELGVHLTTTYLGSWEEEPTPGVVDDHAGEVYSGAIYAHWRGNVVVSYDFDSFGVSVTERWIGEAEDVNSSLGPTGPYFNVPDMWYTDLQGYVDIGKARLSAGIDNVFDEQPPFFNSYTDQNTDPQSYDLIGRFFWVRASVELQ